ncbi:MAG: glycosyltransferase [Alphaproteobacteria bacterium]|nr:glycosyltransferase [Alphaproteobacteria bacterium]
MLSIAVIVPVLNESGQIGELLASLGAHEFSERIVVDGGSTDETAEIAAHHGGVTVVAAPRDRGMQLNAGAAAATADVFVFLHADTRLPPGACETIRRTLAGTNVAGGSFRLRFDNANPALAAYSFFSRFDTAFTTFGDQAYFMTTATFRSCGGFPDWPFLEDVELRRRIRRAGRFVKADATVVTSARRFVAEGIFKRQLLNLSILALHLAGVPATRLTWFYTARSATDP